MCWCNPSIRTPHCGAINCVPPVSLPQPEWQKRVIEEKKALDENLAKLRAFIGSLEYARIDRRDQVLLMEQRSAMLDYSNILRDRIARFS